MFIDSMQFMNSSLDKLAKNLSDKDFKYLIEEFGSKNLKLLKQKNVYPYEYMNSFERFSEEKLLAKKHFYSSIKDGKIGDDGKISDGHIDVNDYLTCKKTLNKFEMKNMGDYHDHYLKNDVSLLADVFEEFIDTCLKYYGLDLCYYFSAPGLSWDAMLKMTSTELEKISDIDKYLFIEKGLRGGISHSANRHRKANNEYCPDYDKNKPSTFISYLDINNLYGWAMNEYLPYCRFKWLKNSDKFYIMSISDKSPIAYFLEVELEYPEELHELHNDFLLAPEKLAVSNDMLSKYCKKNSDNYEIKVGDVKKLIPNLDNKTNYVVHYRNLQLYLSLRMKLTKIQRVLKFNRSDWMKNLLISTLKKEWMLLMNLKKIFLD